jgi:predicted RNA binding protein YcfA (HicA-like mRNA interferase family)
LIKDSRDIIKRLLQEGFALVSVSGSHHKFRHAVSRRTVIVVRAMYRQAGWTKD